MNLFAVGKSVGAVLNNIPAMQIGDFLEFSPDFTKTGHEHTMQATFRSNIICSISWLYLLWSESQRLGYPLTGFITRPLASGGTILSHSLLKTETL